MRALLVLAALVATPVLAQSVDPIPVSFLPGGASVEGCRRQWQTDAAVRAFSAPTEVARHTRTVDAMRRVDANDYGESLTAVLEPGRARATRALSVAAIRLDRSESSRVELAQGDDVLVLGSAGEEAVFFSYRDVVYVATLPGYYGGEGMEVLARPVTELWVRLIEHDVARPAAWLNTAQAGIAEREASCGE